MAIAMRDADLKLVRERDRLYMRPYRAGDLDTWLRIQATGPFFAPTEEQTAWRAIAPHLKSA